MKNEKAAQAFKPMPKASLADNLRFNLVYVLPTVLQGAFLRKPRWVAVLSRLRRGFVSPGMSPRLKRYATDAVRVRFLGTPSLLLFDPRAIAHVLDRSPSIYGAPAAKRKGMYHFQPEAVTVSNGQKWKERRAFNESVLCPHHPHPLLPAIHAIVREEAKSLAVMNQVLWDDFANVFERITLRTMFGRAAEPEREIARLLKQLMGRANTPFLPRRERLFRKFHSQLEEAIRTAEPKSLAAMARQVPKAGAIPVADQVTHWLFAMNDTLCENSVRAAGVIHALGATRKRARDEVAGKDLDDPQSSRSLPFLAACLEEAMRLWPSTPFLLREAMDDDTLCGHRVQGGDQIVIPNLFNHVDATAFARATEWYPERWLQASELPRFHHFSAGSQSCPGADLARFIGIGVLAMLIAGRERQTLLPRVVSECRLPGVYNPFAIQLVDMRRQP